MCLYLQWQERQMEEKWCSRSKLTQQLLSPCRRWVLQQILRQCSAGGRSRRQQQQHQGEAEPADAERSQQLSDHLARTLHQEMKVCCDAACRYPSNYNAWSHRIWVLQHMAMGNVKVGSGIFLSLSFLKYSKNLLSYSLKCHQCICST